MKAKYKENQSLSRETLYISYHPRNKELIQLLKKATEHILGEVYVYDEYHNQYPLPILYIYYVEIVDHRVFVYTKDKDFRMYGTLQSVKEKLKSFGFFQINMRTLVNRFHIEKCIIKEEGRRHIYMDNQEVLVVNRHYKKELNKIMEGNKNAKI